MGLSEGKTKEWKTYEEVAAHLLNQFSSHFGVGRFEGKQDVTGNISGTPWEIDAKGCTDEEGTFLIVECKRHTTRGIEQEVAAGLAWRIQDTGAYGGILVSPIGLQKGAAKVAAATKIVEVKLDKNSTTTNYVIEFLGQLCVGRSVETKFSIGDQLKVQIIDKDGNVIEEHRPEIN